MKRFYQRVTVAPEGPEGVAPWRVLLDGRPIRTVGGRPQMVPSRAFAEALAAEWDGQPQDIDPARFVFRDLADCAIDVVAPDRTAAIAMLLAYAETDTLCYRADPGEALHERQRAVWEPLLRVTERRHAIRFERVSGIIHRPQPSATLGALRARLETMDDFTLAALRCMASLSTSLVIALAALEADADVPALWMAAALEEEWQADLWGREPEAEARRARRRSDFLSARQFAGLAGGLTLAQDPSSQG